MKKLILTLSIALAGITFGYSQTTVAPSADDGAKTMVARMTKTCTLTPDQVAKVKPDAEAFFKAKSANKAKYASDPDGMKTANTTARQNFAAQLKTILTPEQMDKFKAQQKAAKEAKAGDKDKE